MNERIAAEIAALRERGLAIMNEKHLTPGNALVELQKSFAISAETIIYLAWNGSVKEHLRLAGRARVRPTSPELEARAAARSEEIDHRSAAHVYLAGQFRLAADGSRKPLTEFTFADIDYWRYEQVGKQQEMWGRKGRFFDTARKFMESTGVRILGELSDENLVQLEALERVAWSS